MKAKIIVLGSGDAFGMPVCFNCKYCKRIKRTRFSVLLESKRFSLLFDLSPDIKFQIFRSRINIKKIKYVFISHYHFDHIFGLPDFLQLANANKISLKIFCNKETKKYIAQHFYWLKLKVKEFKYYRKIRASNFSIVPFPVNHGNIISSGFLINEKILLIPDFSSVNNKTLEFLKKFKIKVGILDGQYIYGKSLKDPFHADEKYLKYFLNELKMEDVYFVGINEHFVKPKKNKLKILKDNAVLFVNLK